MISRATLFTAPGGDTIQIESTAKYLRKLGVEVDIKLADDFSIDYRDYDLLHLFNVIRPNDLLYHIKKSNKPFVLSTIYVDYSEYEQKIRGGVLGTLSKLINKYKVEYLKTIARAITSGEKIVSPIYLILGQKRSMKYLLRNAAYLLPNSLSEMRRIETDLNTRNRFEVIPNAIDVEKFKPQQDNTKREGVICVARIEGLKNQLYLIKAINDLNIHLAIVGKSSPNHKKYYETCKSVAGINVTFIDHISQDELKHIYSNAKVHILPSWFETTGLSSLEAAYMGCNIVITKKGDTEEYFGKYATYCEPDDVESIRNAIETAYYLPYPEELKEWIDKNYVWNITAKKTLEVYKKVVK